MRKTASTSTNMAFVIINNRLLPGSEATISIQDRGFKFGDGLFETLRVHRGVPYQFAMHLARLHSGLTALRIDADLTDIPAQCRELLRKNAVEDGLLRIQITRGSGSRGYLPMPETPPSVVIETAPLPQLPRTSLALWLSSYRKIPTAS